MGLHDKVMDAHISVKCYYCGAEPGERCTGPKGNKLAKPHRDRIKEGTEKYIQELGTGEREK